MIKKNVAQATRMANRFRPLFMNYCRFAIANCQSGFVPIDNRQSRIENA